MKFTNFFKALSISLLCILSIESKAALDGGTVTFNSDFKLESNFDLGTRNVITNKTVVLDDNTEISCRILHQTPGRTTPQIYQGEKFKVSVDLDRSVVVFINPETKNRFDFYCVKPAPVGGVSLMIPLEDITFDVLQKVMDIRAPEMQIEKMKYEPSSAPSAVREGTTNI